MVYGPCGGAHPDGGCEVVAGPCVFREPTPVPIDQQRTGTPLPATPLVLTDFSTPPFDRAALRRTAEIVAPSCDAVLVGEHQDRPDFPPTLFATLLRDAGLRPWITLACRDRNRIGLEQELAGLRQVGVDAVLCVTGDARAYDVRPDVTQVFDLDGPRLTMLAAAHGLPAAVPETITAAPAALRPARLVDKQRCGASVAVLNHVGDPGEVARFVAAARALGLHIPVIAAVAVYTDETSAAALAGLPGLTLDAAAVRQVLTAHDPRAAGIDVAVAEARALLAVDGVAGVNLSGLASAAGWEHAAGIKADVGLLIREELGR
jgi:5,10-methylenetetrahydrofolate reductase